MIITFVTRWAHLMSYFLTGVIVAGHSTTELPRSTLTLATLTMRLINFDEWTGQHSRRKVLNKRASVGELLQAPLLDFGRHGDRNPAAVVLNSKMMNSKNVMPSKLVRSLPCWSVTRCPYIEKGTLGVVLGVFYGYKTNIKGGVLILMPSFPHSELSCLDHNVCECAWNRLQKYLKWVKKLYKLIVVRFHLIHEIFIIITTHP